MSSYKTCAVPMCKSTTIKNPDKLFIHVPKCVKLRKQWIKLARRNPDLTSNNATIYFCEDHFDLPNDMENYMEYHIVGSVAQVRMKPGCIPTKFACQPDRKKRTCGGEERSYILKKRRMTAVAECLNESEEICTASTSPQDTCDISLDPIKVEQNEEVILCKTADKYVQVLITHKFRSKAVQTNIKFTDRATSPVQLSPTPTSTSSLKSEALRKLGNFESIFFKVKRKRNILVEPEHSDSDFSLYMPSSATNSRSSSVHSLQIQSSSDCSEYIEEDKNQNTKEIIMNTIKKIEKRPRLYIGVSNSCYYLIDIIQNQINITKHHLLLCLNKIRLDTKFIQLADDYGMTSSCISKIFSKNIPIIASVLHPFIVTLNNEMIKRTLPVAFSDRHYNYSCIIDCLEIEVQKPKKAENQSLTWSDYKKAYTIKYLISCMPNGIINYISPGFGGRITDTCLIESCNFVNTLQSGMCVMAHRGFKHLEQYLLKSGITLVRPSSVQTGRKICKSEEKLKRARIHMERVTRRIREYYMLKPHACINFKLVKILDDIMIIACALVNLQDSSMQMK